MLGNAATWTDDRRPVHHAMNEVASGPQSYGQVAGPGGTDEARCGTSSAVRDRGARTRAVLARGPQTSWRPGTGRVAGGDVVGGEASGSPGNGRGAKNGITSCE